MNREVTAKPPLIGRLSLLEMMIVVLTSCSLVIFIFTISAKHLEMSTFDKLPEFLQNSYAAIWSAGIVAGGALVGSVIDALSNRDSSRANFFIYTLGTTIVLMLMVFSTILISKATEKPKVTVPYGAIEIDVSKDAEVAKPFALSNHVMMQLNGTISGEYSIKDGVVSGKVSDSSLQFPTFQPGPFPPPPSVKIVSIHACYLSAQNGIPILLQQPAVHTKSNEQMVDFKPKEKAPQAIPNFEFKFEPRFENSISPAYLCAMVEFENNFKAVFF